jgi:hypothetical protein
MRWMVAWGGVEEKFNPETGQEEIVVTPGDVNVRNAEGSDVFAAMKDAYGITAENMSVRRLRGTARYEAIQDFIRCHLERVKKLKPGHDRLVLPGLQRTAGKPKAEEYVC